ncbi:MAG: substrate-binding domain-containing protein [Spirochaetales bacterium]|nr:substrate-binding domain-containing protein [Spirochaetales bacterium]
MAAGKKIGFLFSDFDDSRALAFYHGVTGLSSKAGYTMVMLPAGPLGSQEEAGTNDRSGLIELVRLLRLDAIITFQFWESCEWFESVLARHTQTPILTVLRKYAGYPGILVTHEDSLFRAVTHLVHEHRCKNIIFCAGTETDAQEYRSRLNGYKKALIECSIEFRPEYVLFSKDYSSPRSAVNETKTPGKMIAEELFHTRGWQAGKDVDAIVAFNDHIAMNIITALADMGIRVPHDIRVIGYDNSPESETADPPLTTLGIRWEEMGKAAMNIVSAMEKETDSTEFIPAAFVIRESCGCTSAIKKLMEISPAAIDDTSFQTIIGELHHSYTHIKELAQNCSRKEQSQKTVRSIGQLLAEYHTLDDAFTALSDYLPALHLSYCAVFRAHHDTGTLSCTQIYEFADGMWQKDNDRTPLDRCAILEKAAARYKGSLVVEPLYVGSTQIGFAVFSMEDIEYAVYDELRNTISNVIYTADLIINLQNTLSDLKKAQAYLIESEKLAALGQLVAGIAHEINTPVGIGITASSYLKSKAEEYRNTVTGNDINPAVLNKQLETIEESSDLILRNLVRAGELIGSFKQVAVDNANDVLRSFNLKEYLHDILVSLGPAIKKTSHAIVLYCPDDLKLHTYPGLFSQIFSNLILNSLTHGLSGKPTPGTIHIHISRRKDKGIAIHYTDDGKGMEKDVLRQIFNPFFTTNRPGGGSGLGMFIVYTIIHQKLKGSISVESSPGQGIDIHIELPPALDTRATGVA